MIETSRTGVDRGEVDREWRLAKAKAYQKERQLAYEKAITDAGVELSSEAKLKGSIGERSNHSNHSKICKIFAIFC